MTQDAQSAHRRSLILPTLALAAGAFLWASMLTLDAGDWPNPGQFPHNSPARNACGPVGAWCAYQLHYFLGDGAYPLLLFATLAAILRLVRGHVGSVVERAVGLTLVIACTSASVHLLSGKGVGILPVGNGGLFGYALGELMRRNLSSLGTFIVLASSFFVGLLFTTEGWVLKIPLLLKRASQASGQAVATARQAVAAAAASTRPKAVTATEGLTLAERSAVLDDDSDQPIVKKPGRNKKRKAAEQDEASLFDEEQDESEASDALETNAVDDEPETHESLADSDSGQRGAPRKASAKKRAARNGPIVNFPSQQNSDASEPYPRQIENWTLPSIDLLEVPEYGFTAQQEVVVRQQAKILEQTLEEFRLNASVVEIDTGPVITMFELKIGAGIKVSQIASLSNDIARALKAHAIRVVAPISGKNTVGIEVPNLNKEKVRLKELMMVSGKKASSMALPLFLGKDAAGAPIATDLARMPHVLIAGTTGSGKSVCINSIILSLLMTKRPDHVKMILIDPKMVEMSQFKEVPHLMCPIVTDMKRAEQILEWAVTTMEERYSILAEARVKNIAHYNSLGESALFDRLKPANDAERARIIVRLPYIVLIIDELADLIMTSPKEVEHNVARLAQKSRAVGIHIIVATQRPEAKVVTGLIKSNLPTRICFRVASRMDSRIVLDQNGGEVLMGQGDLLYLPPGSHKLIRAQGTFLEESETQAVLDDLASRAQPEFHPALMRIKTTGSDESGAARDPLFDDAVRIILESRRGSVSLLQRRLTVGYSRASRLVDQMSDAGIVGDYKGSQAREVLMTLDEWEALQDQVNADLDSGYEADQEDDEPIDSESEDSEENDPDIGF